MNKLTLTAALVAALFVSACGLHTSTAAARAAYCQGVSETGKVVVRNVLTGGVQVIHCDPPEVPADVTDETDADD